MKDFYKMTVKEKVAALENLADKVYLRDLLDGQSYAWLRLPDWIFGKVWATIQKFLLTTEAFLMSLYTKILKRPSNHLIKQYPLHQQSEISQEMKNYQWWLEQNARYREKAFEDEINEKWFRLKRIERIRNKSKK